MNFLFWNMGRLSRIEALSKIVDAHAVNVVALAECETSDTEVLGTLGAVTSRAFRCPYAGSSRIRVYADRDSRGFEEVYANNTSRLTVRSFQLSGVEVLLAVAHLPAPVGAWGDPRNHQDKGTVLSQEIRDFESKRGHRRTVLVGDLNMNPFDPGMVSALGLHAMMTREIVSQGRRTVQGDEYPFFYNPMWGFFGDRTPGPPGTFHFRSPTYHSYDWNIIDQVLFRPEILRWFDGRIEVLTRAGDRSLCDSNGRPDKLAGSDHFPVFFALRDE